MNRRDDPYVATALAALVGLGLLLRLILRPATLLEVAAWAGLVAAAAALTWFLLRRPLAPLTAAAVLALWAPLHTAPLAWYPGIILVGALLLVPLRDRALQVVLAGATGLVVAWILAGPHPLAILGAGVAAAGAAALRPEHPTLEWVRGFRRVALFLPAAGLVAALVLNAATRRVERVETLYAVTAGLALLALFALGTLALLGLGTYLESNDPCQARAWLALAVAVAAATATLVHRDPRLTIASLSVAAVPLAVLVAVLAERLAGHGHAVAPWVRTLPAWASVVTTLPAS